MKEKNGNVVRNIRKMYMMIADTGAAVLILELEQKEVINKLEMLQNILKGVDYSDVVAQLTSCEKEEKLYILPFKNNTFGCSCLCSDTKYQKPNITYSRYWMSQKSSLSDNSSDGSVNIPPEVKDFFSHPFQMFWICVLQRTELIRCSYVTSIYNVNQSISASDILYENAMFRNRFDTYTCTPDVNGQEIYESIRANMHLKEEIEHLQGKMESISRLETNRAEKRLNGTVLFLTIVSIIVNLIFSVCEVAFTNNDKVPLVFLWWHGVVLLIIIFIAFAIMKFYQHKRYRR